MHDTMLQDYLSNTELVSKLDTLSTLVEVVWATQVLKCGSVRERRSKGSSAYLTLSSIRANNWRLRDVQPAEEKWPLNQGIFVSIKQTDQEIADQLQVLLEKKPDVVDFCRAFFHSKQLRIEILALKIQIAELKAENDPWHLIYHPREDQNNTFEQELSALERTMAKLTTDFLTTYHLMSGILRKHINQPF